MTANTMSVINDSIEWTTIGLLITTLCIFRLTYNVVLHPLREFPGPIANRATLLPKLYHLLTGRLPYHVREVHTKYGSVVRIRQTSLHSQNHKHGRTYTLANRDVATSSPMTGRFITSRIRTAEQLYHRRERSMMSFKSS